MSSVQRTHLICFDVILHQGIMAENNPGSSAIDWWLLTVSNPLPGSRLNILSTRSSLRTAVNLLKTRSIIENMDPIIIVFKYLTIGPKIAPPQRGLDRTSAYSSHRLILDASSRDLLSLLLMQEISDLDNVGRASDCFARKMVILDCVHSESTRYSRDMMTKTLTQMQLFTFILQSPTSTT